DVRDPWLTIDHDAQQHVRAYPSFRRTAAHAAEEQADVVVEVAKRRGQQRVVLEAVAAAALIDELPFQRVEREVHAAPGLDVDVVEEERAPVGAVDAPQRAGIGALRLLFLDSVQVAGEPHHHTMQRLSCGRTIASVALQPKAVANSGMFVSGALARKRSSGCGSVVACSRSASGRPAEAQ